MHNKFICFIFALAKPFRADEPTAQTGAYIIMYKAETKHHRQIAIELSDDRLKNEIMRLYGDRFLFVGINNDSTIDSYIKKTGDDQYQMKVWNMLNRWGDGFKFAEIATHNNNTDSVLTFTKQGDSWHIDLHQRRYYGLPNIDTQIQ